MLTIFSIIKKLSFVTFKLVDLPIEEKLFTSVDSLLIPPDTPIPILSLNIIITTLTTVCKKNKDILKLVLTLFLNVYVK